MGYPVTIDLDIILNNNYLICDFLFNDKYNKSLLESDHKTKLKFISSISNEEKIRQLARLIYNNHYESYLGSKSGTSSIEPLKKQLKSVSGYDKVKKLFDAFHNLFGGMANTEKELKEKISELNLVTTSEYIEQLLKKLAKEK